MIPAQLSIEVLDTLNNLSPVAFRLRALNAGAPLFAAMHFGLLDHPGAAGAALSGDRVPSFRDSVFQNAMRPFGVAFGHIFVRRNEREDAVHHFADPTDPHNRPITGKKRGPLYQICKKDFVLFEGIEIGSYLFDNDPAAEVH